MNRRILFVVLVAVIAMAAACSKIETINAPVLTSGSANFSVYAAIGTSLSAGSQSGGGIVYRHQLRSFTADFATQARTTFTLPTISDFGFNQLWTLTSLSPLVICTDCRTNGTPTNLDQATPYNNMAVPGAILVDVADSTLYYNAAARGALQVQRFDWIVRHRGTILTEVLALHPTFVTFEIGSNEVLGPATQGSGTPILSGATYAGGLHLILAGLAAGAPSAKLALINVPDVTTVPFCTTIKPWVVNPATGRPVLDNLGHRIPLIGTSGPLDPNDLVLLTAAASLAQGIGIPTALGGTGLPLPDSQVLSVAEAASLQATVSAYNAAIATEATARGAALVDLNGLLKRVATTGIVYQGTRYTNAFITGGLFSLDGFHPNDFAHGLIANLIIDAVNAKFGATVPHVNLSEVASATASSMRPGAKPTPMQSGGAWPMIQNAAEAYRAIAPVPAVGALQGARMP